MSSTRGFSLDEIVGELDRARRERDEALTRMHAATAEAEGHRATRADRSAASVERYRQECEREAITWSTEARRLLDTGEVPPDPFAQAHRKTLWDALRQDTT